MKKYQGIIAIILLCLAMLGIVSSFCYAAMTGDKETAKYILLISLILLGAGAIFN